MVAAALAETRMQADARGRAGEKGSVISPEHRSAMTISAPYMLA